MGFSPAFTITDINSSYTFTTDRHEIISFSYEANCPDYGTSGVCTASVSAVLANLTPNTAAVAAGDKLSITAINSSAYYTVSDVQTDKYTTTVTAYDNCSKLDAEFDNTNILAETVDPQTGKTIEALYNETYVLAAIATQLSPISISSTTGQSMYSKDDLKGTCRSILEKIAEINGIVWVDTGLSITPIRFIGSQPSYAGSLAVSNSAEVEVVGETYHTTGVVVLNDITNGVRYDGGLLSGTVFKYIDSEQVKGNAAVYTTVNGMANQNYTSLSISNAIVSGTFVAPAAVAIGSATKKVLNISARLTAAGLLCDLSSPVLLNDSATYKRKQEREDKKSVKKGEKVGCFFLNENYSGVKIEVTASS